MQEVAPLGALVLFTLIPPAQAQVAAGVLLFGFVAYQDRKPTSRQAVVAAWTLWAAQRAYIPTLVEDSLEISDVAALAVGLFYFGLGAYKSLDPSLYPVASATLVLAALAPVHPHPTYLYAIWTSAVFTACVSGLEFCARHTPAAHLAHHALAAGWVLVVRFHPVYVCFQILYAIYVSRDAYGFHERSETKEAQMADVEASLPPPPQRRPAAERKKGPPKPVVTLAPILHDGIYSEKIDPAACRVPPFLALAS
jgi:hypothetical protein